MKKILSLILLISCLLTLCGCGSKKAEAISMDLSALYSQMEASLPEMTAYGENKILNNYGIKPEYYTEALVYVSSDGLLADEIWLIKAKDADSLAKIQKLAQNRLQAKDDESVTYSPEQNKIVKEGKILTRGDYLALIVSPQVTALTESFQSAK